MSALTPAERMNAIHCIKSGISRLTTQQAEALRGSIYVIMSSEEARAFDDRHATISKLGEALKGLGAL